MRPIDADALKAEQQEDADLFINDSTISGKIRRDEALNAVANIVNAPTIDAVPVIRCKDCKHKNEYGYCTMYLNFHHLTADMDYCSDAERMDEDETD